MALELKKWTIDTTNLNRIWAELHQKECAIIELKSLNNPNISDEEFLSIIHELYHMTFNEQEILEYIKQALNSSRHKNIKRGLIITDSITTKESLNYHLYDFYLAFWAFSTNPNLFQISRNFGKKYSLDEIRQLIEQKELVLLEPTTRKEKGYYGQQYQKSSPEHITAFKDLALDNFSLESLILYSSILIPYFKGIFTHERVAQDIILFIANAKEEITRIKTIISLQQNNTSSLELKRVLNNFANYLDRQQVSYFN